MSHPLPRLFVAYARVSTAKQGRSGLGLEAQREAIDGYLRQRGGTLLHPVFVEVESGKRDENRPELTKARAKCQATGATLLIAKLDRLSRDAHFLLGLQKDGVTFVAADNPDVNEMTIGILAVVAQAERKMASQRTKEALSAAKARGTKLGGLRPGQRAPTAEEARSGAKISSAIRQRASLTHAHQLAPTINAALGRGVSLQGIARELQAAEMPSPRGGTWTATAVRRVIAKLGLSAEPEPEDSG